MADRLVNGQLLELVLRLQGRIKEQGVRANRAAIGFVVRGALYAGVPLHGQSPPTAAEIGSAFAANVLSRAAAASIALSDDETLVVRAWLGAPSEPVA